MSTALENLRARRQTTWLQAKALTDRVATENRAFQDDER